MVFNIFSINSICFSSHSERISFIFLFVDSPFFQKLNHLYSLLKLLPSQLKLAFQRDTSIPNYARIKELEAKYAEILNSEPTELPAIFSLKTHLIIGGILCLLYLVPGVIYFIIYFKKKKENANWYEKKYAEWSEKINTEGKRILEEATSLLS